MKFLVHATQDANGEFTKKYVSAETHSAAARAVLGTMPLPAGSNPTGRVRYYRMVDGREVTVAVSHYNIF